MGPRPLLTPRLSPLSSPLPRVLPVPGRLALWNQMPQGQPCERPYPNPFDHPCPDVVVRPRNKEEMEAREKLQVQFRRDWRFHVNISPPRGQAAAWELPASAGGMQRAEEGPGGGPWGGSRRERSAAESREPGSGCSAVPGRCSPCFPFPAEPLLSAGSHPLWAASLLRASGPSSSSPLGGLPPLLGFLAVPRLSNCRGKDADKNAAQRLVLQRCHTPRDLLGALPQ